MKAKDHLILIHLLEDSLDMLKSGSCDLSEESCYSLIDTMRELIHPNKPEFLSKQQAADLLHISIPTLNKRIKEGKVPQPKKIAGLKEKVFLKEDILKIK